MNIERQLTDTFTAHEDLAPDADVAWDGVQRRLGRGRSVARPLAIAASVLVVAGAATGVAALTDRTGDHPAAASRTALSSTTASAPTKRAVTPLTMPFDLGWLPAGDVSYLARRINVGAAAGSSTPVLDGEYLLTIKTAGGTLDVDVQQMPGGLGGTHFKCGGHAAVTIAGRPGIESADAGGLCGYEVYFRDAAGGTAYVNVARPDSAPGPAKKLTTIGRRIAANLHFPGHSTVRPLFTVGYVPAGLRMTSFDIASGTNYTLGADARNPLIDVGTNLGGLHGAPGPKVQGHPTRFVDVGGRRMVSVLGAVHGKPVGIAGSVSKAELYRIADGLVLP